jgi:AcrR family transcriptional regulator
MAEVIRIGRRHLAESGAASLSLRAVARDLGVVSSAVYRYVASRDELLTLLVVDGYNELADAVDAALAESGADARDRFGALATAVRTYALREPAMYALLFGTPVPGYAAPAERTTGPGTRVIRRLASLCADAYAAGDLTMPPVTPVPATLSAEFDAIGREFDVPAPDELVARTLLVWAGIFGAVTWELFGHYGRDTFTQPAALFEHHVEVLAQTLGFAPTPARLVPVER